MFKLNANGAAPKVTDAEENTAAESAPGTKSAAVKS
jgi:hypothetical protein